MVRVRMAVAVVGAVVAGLLVSAGGSQAATGQWYKTDLHVHSVFSADAYPDLGILTTAAKAAGFNAVFLTDHNLASNFPISGMTANNVFLPEAPAGSTPPRRWVAGTTGSLSSKTSAVVTSPVASSPSSSSMHLASTSSSAGESFIWTERGPQLRASDAMLTFAVDVKQLTGGSGVYVSAAIGGDPTIKSPANNPVGYTTTAGVVSPGKSNVLVWYFGAPPPSSFYGTAHVISHPLSTSNCDKAFALSTWVTCTVDMTAAAKSDIPSADQPLDYDAFTDLKMSAVGNAGTADAYFDNYSVQATSDSAEEFVYRNSIIDSGAYNVPGSFMIFPSVEMGTNEHAQRFNFDIKDPSQFTSYQNGIDGIAPTQATGYPAQLNHPGVAGGVTDAQAISTDAEGADLMEVRQQNMINDWDAILRTGHPLVGTWGGDNHIGKWTTGSQATEIWAPSLDFDALTTALKQGQIFLTAGVSGMTFNLDGSSTPYPAATPVTVSSSQTSQQVHLSIAGGINSGDTVKWLSNNGSTSTTSTIATDTVSGTSYSATKTVALSGASTYVRAEVWRGTKLRGMTEAIMFSRSGSADTQPPTTPTGLSATAFGSSQINLAWTGSTDNVQVSGYRIYRDGGSTPVAAVTSTSYADTGLAAGSTHSYVVTAVDSSGNESAPSNQASATTDSAGSVQTVTLAPVADAYVNGGSTTSNYGSSTALRVDASPDVRSYLQFNLSGVSGTVTSAVLHVWATSSQSTGYQAVPLADPGATWGESTINYTNAPPLAAATPAYGSSGPVTTGTWTTVDVTGFVTAVEGGVATLALTTPSSTALALASRQSTNPPQLVITTG